jgi:hypothetical protein
VIIHNDGNNHYWEVIKSKINVDPTLDHEKGKQL